ncbi:hypothetical protein CGZ69_32150 [Streptomyces peucetius subsp. caesius ATCC 27952]|nr:hypothetical protein CGZ69_32150 [Streptomyces peucetius subsp. caesius ATCC 27952]
MRTPPPRSRVGWRGRIRFGRPAEADPAVPSFRRRAAYMAGAAALLCLVGAGWIVVTGLIARSELLAAQRSLEALRHSISAPAPNAAQAAAGPQASVDPKAAMRSAAGHAARAHHLTSGPAWYVAAQVPFVGRPLTTVRGVTHAAHRLTHDVLPPVVSMAAGSKDSRDGGLQDVLSRLDEAAPDFERAAQVAADTRDETRELPSHTWVGAADQARARLVRQLDRITPVMTDAAVAARVVPPMLGADNPRRYLVVFQNTAEARGTGGLPGAFAVLTVEHGQPRFETFGTDTMLAEAEPSIDMGAEYTAQYARMDPVGTWANSNISPHFPHAARIWSAAWYVHSGERVDGVLALDPSGLARLLRATGPARMPDGTQLTADNALDLAERDGYARYPDSVQRKSFLLDVARTAATSLMEALGDPQRLPALLRGTYDVMTQERLKVWSARDDEQRLLMTRPLSGVLPATPGPFAGVVVNNAAGGKLDYYLDRELRWIPGRCTGDGRLVTARITLTNRAPATGLPPYVTQRGDKPPYPTRPGDNRLLVSYYASKGARLTALTVDGRPTMLHSGVERGHPVYTADVELPAQSSRTLTLRLVEPVSQRPPVLLRQPLVTPLRTLVDPYQACGA